VGTVNTVFGVKDPFHCWFYPSIRSRRKTPEESDGFSTHGKTGLKLAKPVRIKLVISPVFITFEQKVRIIPAQDPLSFRPKVEERSRNRQKDEKRENVPFYHIFGRMGRTLLVLVGFSHHYSPFCPLFLFSTSPNPR